MQKDIFSNKTEVAILIILTSGIAISYFFPEYLEVGIAFSIIPGAIYSLILFPILTRRYLKGKWQILLLTISIFMFFLIIFAEKELNSQYSIDISYLKNSPIIIGAIYAPILTAILILGLATIFTILKSFPYPFSTNRKATLKSGLNIFIPLIPLMLLGFLLEAIPKNSLDLVLLADAYNYSDCRNAEIENDYLFIRKNNAECYQITNYKISIKPLKWDPVYSIIKSEKL